MSASLCLAARVYGCVTVGECGQVCICCQLLQSGKRKRNETVAGIAINHLCSSLALTDSHSHSHTHMCTKWHKSTYTLMPKCTHTLTHSCIGRARHTQTGTCPQSYAELARVFPKENAAEKLQTYALRFVASSSLASDPHPTSLPHSPFVVSARQCLMCLLISTLEAAASPTAATAAVAKEKALFKSTASAVCKSFFFFCVFFETCQTLYWQLPKCVEQCKFSHWI